ncbi:hypothetical protein HNR06_003144 [Nocardiopsis arvandica]|uniref:Uncharacterized protein n=1 Tax=Nocardiopsis sinuspersici TaxID=501010 RepID=A0A7Y9XFQ7_9ACTN|nr:hypothetical protein [Nocardiopsis sinuspersici]NYH53555.1 hypothetical protein [Nocardiopsis sinuspersici]
MNVHGSPPSPEGPRPGCPDCRAPLPVRPRACPRCGLLLVGGTAQRLWRIDSEIAVLDSRRQELYGERAAVVELLREESAWAVSRAGARPGVHAAGAPGTPGAPHAAEAAGGAWQRPPGPAPAPAPAAAHPQAAPPAGEVTRRSAQNVILGLGGLLVGIAALVFAIWTWSDMGTGARAGVLGVTTAAFAALALPLHRRGLRATAETFGCLAAALLCVDALALWLLMSDRFGGGPGYTAAALAVIGSLLVLYPVLVPLRSPRVIAALLCQPVPVLSVFSLPSGEAWYWALPVLAATAFGDLLVVRWLGEPRPGRPVRTLHVTAAVLWALTLLLTSVLVLADPGSDASQTRWALAAALLLSGATGLLLSRRPLGTATAGRRAPATAPAAIALLALGMTPLAAGPAHLPVLPRVPAAPWSGGPSTATEPVLQVLGLSIGPMTGPAHDPLHLAAIVACAVLSLGAAALLRRDALVPAAALVAPPTLLAFPLLLGLPHVVATVWALLVGAALVLGTVLPPRRRTAWVPAVTGALTLVTGLLWSLPDQYTSLGALLFLNATALVTVLLYRRTASGGVPASAPYGAGLLLWSLALLTGAFFLLGLVMSEAVPPPAWWLLAAAGLLSGATALALGRTPAPFAPADRSAPDPRTPFTLLGLLLLATAPLLAGRAQSPGLPLLPRAEPWSEPVSAMSAPAYSVLGLSAQAGTAASAGTAVAVLAAGVAAVALARLLDRRRTAIAAALAAPAALVPLPLVLDAPLLAALVWTFAVGSALALWSALARDRWVGLVAGATGLLTLVLGSGWALAQEHASTGALMAVAVVGAVVAALARTPVPAICATAVATAATGAFALALPLLLGAPVEYAALAPIAMVAAVAVAAPRLSGPLVLATEVPACLWAVAALVVTVSAGARLELVALALAVVGVIALATAVRPDRRWYASAGALLMFAALWTVLAAWDVAVPEAYTVPPALAALAIGWEWSRKAAETPSSWSAYGGGLMLLLLPTVVLVLMEEGMVWRVPAVLLLGLAVVVWGMRRRLQAALVLGGLVLVTTSLRAFGPPLWDLTRLVPNWLPFAVAGVLLLVIGARYEASLERLRRLGRLVAGMR